MTPSLQSFDKAQDRPSDLQPATVLITGGTGFIGSHLAAAVSAKLIAEHPGHTIETRDGVGRLANCHQLTQT